ncbi:uncharacterized protein EI90DRAFT_3050253 [Cantharellus anzutake]|uniref:uncharacterized protein n=1 Tax=Cantharellus anzutake TaxID=1750568 RepID=UPI001903567A|nr:uncharacterized protein EI90DRAFT_3050253 [Cantharellus anzutake]KAF8334779.1 hypothetical protein EI90DRAFT_3050253 [Cantharellus anzutake]
MRRSWITSDWKPILSISMMCEPPTFPEECPISCPLRLCRLMGVPRTSQRHGRSAKLGLWIEVHLISATALDPRRALDRNLSRSLSSVSPWISDKRGPVDTSHLNSDGLSSRMKRNNAIYRQTTNTQGLHHSEAPLSTSLGRGQEIYGEA